MIDGADKEELLSRFTITTYTGQAVRAAWGSVRGFVVQALAFSREELDIQTVWSACLKELMQLWVIKHEGRVVCVMITELRIYAKKRSCNLVAVAGMQSRNIWKIFAPYLKTWLTANSVDEVQATCRPSVARLIRTLGFRETAQVMTISCKEWLP